MKRYMTTALALPLVGILSIGLAPAADRSYPFKIGEVDLAMQTPDGFCVPTALYAAQADALAKGDPQNVTVVTLLACDRSPAVSPWANYVLVKAPIIYLNAAVPKAEALAQIDAEMSRSKSSLIDDKMSEDIANSSEKTLGTRVEMRGSFAYAGRDTDCVYMAGPLQGKADGREKAGQLATCITVSGQRFFAVNIYEFPAVKSIEALKAQVHDIAMAIHP